MINKVVVLLILCFSISNMLGQNKVKTPGYMGKRFTVELNLGMGYMYTTKANIKPNSFQGNLHPELTLSYSLSKRIDFGLKAGYDQVKLRRPDGFSIIPNSTNIDYYSPSLDPHIDDYNTGYEVQYEGQNVVGRAINFQLFFRLYQKHYIAPVGFYHQVAFGMSRLSFKNTEMIFSFVESPDNQFSVPLISYNIYQISYAVGNKRMLKNNFYLNTGFELNVFFRRRLRGWKYGYSKSGSNEHQFIEPSLLAVEIMLSQLLEFKIGIGKIF